MLNFGNAKNLGQINFCDSEIPVLIIYTIIVPLMVSISQLPILSQMLAAKSIVKIIQDDTVKMGQISRFVQLDLRIQTARVLFLPA